MQITDPISNPRLFIERTRADALQQLRPGQVVRAVVEAPVDKGVAQLNIGGMKVPVKTAMRLEAGQQLALDVIKSGGAPEFKVIREVTPAMTQALALKAILPKQLPLNQLLDTLRSLTAVQQTTTSSLSPVTGNNSLVDTLLQQLLQQAGPPPSAETTGNGPLERNLQTIVSALGRPVQGDKGNNPAIDLARQVGQLINHALSGYKPLTGAVIRQVLSQSGLFLEPRLLNGQPMPGDLKANLLRLLETLQPMLTPIPMAESVPGRASDTGTALQLLAARLFAELHHQADGALARIQLHQLASLPQEENSLRQHWQFELPIAYPDGHDEFLIQFEKETRPSGQAEERWSVTLNFNIAPTGPVCAKLSLVGDEISSHFTAELADGASRIEKLLPTLNAALASAGLKVGQLSATRGKAVRTPDQSITPLPLLDERA